MRKSTVLKGTILEVLQLYTITFSSYQVNIFTDIPVTSLSTLSMLHQVQNC
jgi:hypothetical protein